MGKPVYFDTGVVLDTMEEAQFLRIVRNHGADKILFATDSPWAGQKEFVALLQKDAPDRRRKGAGSWGETPADCWESKRNIMKKLAPVLVLTSSILWGCHGDRHPVCGFLWIYHCPDRGRPDLFGCCG